MVSVIGLPIKIPEEKECVLPLELITDVLKRADLCSKIIKLTDDGIAVVDFITRKLIRNIKSKYFFKLSVSRCGNFVVGSSGSYPVDVWNINTGLKVTIDPVHSDLRFEAPSHTFTLNNELLVTVKNRVFSFEFDRKRNSWIINFVYEIMDDNAGICCIQANQSEHTFACATYSRKVYIFNSLSKQVEMVVNTKGMSSDDEIISLEFNKHILIISGIEIKYAFDFNTTRGVLLQKPAPRSRSVMDVININKFCLLPCLTKVIGGSNGISFVWDIKTGKIIKRVDVRIQSFSSLTPEGTQLVTCERSSSVSIINLLDLIYSI
jgi:WD40 repeat protein